MNTKRIRNDSSFDTTGLPCPASCASPPGRIRGFVGSLISCCPYTMLVKKILRFLRGEPGTPPEPLTNREISLKSNLKIGYGIMLIGVFCPIFWFSYLSGARGSELMFNAVHSGIVILFGFLYSATYWIQLRNERMMKKHNEPDLQQTP